MYSYIKGEITAKENGIITVEACGVGWSICASTACLESCALGSLQTVYTHLNIKEDAHTLFGFVSDVERNLFRQCLSVSGVGAKSALALISMGSQNLCNSIASGNSQALSKIKGISERLAAKIIVDLQGKLVKDVTFMDNSAFVGNPLTSQADDAIDGLVNLGLTRNTALELIRPLKLEGMSAEQIVIAALEKRGGKA